MGALGLNLKTFESFASKMRYLDNTKKEFDFFLFKLCNASKRCTYCMSCALLVIILIVCFVVSILSTCI